MLSSDHPKQDKGWGDRGRGGRGRGGFGRGGYRKPEGDSDFNINRPARKNAAQKPTEF